MSLRRVFWLLPLVLLPLPLWLNQYQQYVLNTALLYVPVGIGFNLVVGNLGLLAFSNVAYFGLGAYASGVLMAQFSVPWWITLLPAALIGGAAGAIASIPALRGVRLFYLAIMTLAYALLMPLMPDDEHGTMTGFYSLSRGIGIVAGPIIAGVLISLTSRHPFGSTQGFQAMWIVCAAGAFGSIPFVRRLRRAVDRDAALEAT